MRVKVINDVCVKVVSDGPFKGKFVLWPNSVRADVTHDFSLPRDAKVRDKVWEGKDLK